MRLRFQIQGVDDVIHNFSLFDLEMTKAIRKALTRSANQIRKEARNRAPKDPNHDKVHANRQERLKMSLSQSIKLKYSNDRFTVSIYPRRYYAHWVEYGTEHSRPKPFMHPAFTHEKPRYLRNVDDAIKSVLARRSAR